MVKRTAPIRASSFLLLAACGALCQTPPAIDLLQGFQFGSNSPEAQRLEIRAWSSLPDAPSPVQPPTHAERFHAFVDEARSPLTLGAAGADTGVMRKTELDSVTLGARPSSLSLYQSAPVQKESGASAFLDKYLHPLLLKQDQSHSPSTSGSFIGRTYSAASHIFITRDDSGKGRLNTSYILGVLTSAALHTASRPYWAQSTSATFNDFGSTIGGNAGINVFHEFEPGIRQIVKGHVPKFLSRIQERITQDHTTRDFVSMPAR